MQIQTQIRNPSDSSSTSSPATQSTTTTTTTTTNIANLGLQVRADKETKPKPEAQNGTRGRGQQRQGQQNESNPKPKPRTKRQIMLAGLELGLNEQHLVMLKLLANYQMLTGFQICALSELPQYQYLRPRPRARSKFGYDAGYLFDIYSATATGTGGSAAGGYRSRSGSGSTLARVKDTEGEFSFTKWLSNIRRQQFRRTSRLKKAGFAATTNHNKGDPAVAVWYITDDGVTYLASQTPEWSKATAPASASGAAGAGGNANRASQFLQLGHTVGVNQVTAGLVLATSEFTDALLRHTLEPDISSGSTAALLVERVERRGIVEVDNWYNLYRLETDPFYLQFTSSLSAPALVASGSTGTATATATAPKTAKAKKPKVKEQAAVIYTPDLSGRISLQSSQPGLIQFALKVAGITDLDNMLLRAATATATATTAGANAGATIGPTTSTAPVALIQTKQQQQQASQPPSLSKYLVPDNGFGIISPAMTAKDGGSSSNGNGNGNDEELPSTAASAVWPFFLEYDRATEDPAVFAEKAVALTALFNDRKAWLPQWGGRFPTVLVVVEADSSYLSRLIKYTRSKLAEQKGRWGDNRPSGWWFTTMGAFATVFTRTQESYYKFVDEPEKLVASLSSFVPTTSSSPNKKNQRRGNGAGAEHKWYRILPSTAPIWLPITARARPEEMVKNLDDWVSTLVVAGQDSSATKQIPITLRDEDRQGQGQRQGQGTYTRKALVLDMANPLLKNHPQRNYGMVGLPILNFVS